MRATRRACRPSATTSSVGLGTSEAMRGTSEATHGVTAVSPVRRRSWRGRRRRCRAGRPARAATGQTRRLDKPAKPRPSRGAARRRPKVPSSTNKARVLCAASTLRSTVPRAFGGSRAKVVVMAVPDCRCSMPDAGRRTPDAGRRSDVLLLQVSIGIGTSLPENNTFVIRLVHAVLQFTYIHKSVFGSSAFLK